MGQCQIGGNLHQPVTEEFPDSKQPGFSSVYHHSGINKLEYTPVHYIRNMLDLYNNSVKLYENKTALGTTTMMKAPSS
jgi:hypothetical protein